MHKAYTARDTAGGRGKSKESRHCTNTAASRPLLLDSADLAIASSELRKLTLHFAPSTMGSDGSYLSRFLVDDPKFEVIAYDVFIKCNNKLRGLR